MITEEEAFASLGSASLPEIRALFRSLESSVAPDRRSQLRFCTRFFNTRNASPQLVEFALEALREPYKPLTKIKALVLAASYREDEAVLKAIERHDFLKKSDVLEQLPTRIVVQAKNPTALPSNELFRAVGALAGERRKEALAECAERLRRASTNRWERQLRAERGEALGENDVVGWGQWDRLAKLLPLGESDTQPVWRHVSPRILVEIHYVPDLPPGSALWARLPTAARAVWAHRALWSGDGLGADHPARHDPEGLVSSLIGLYECAPGTSDAARALRSALLDYMKDWVSQEGAGPIDLRPLLPGCRIAHMEHSRDFPNAPEVAHCEGVRRFIEGEAVPDMAWCPRLGGDCEQRVCGEDRTWGSRLDPMDGDPGWKIASLVEVLARKRIAMDPEDSKKTFVLEISAYANRLNEIRALLRCRRCAAWLKPDKDYAKRYARYSETVFRCPNPAHHAEGRYFNHCWDCHRIIDSDVCERVPRPNPGAAQWPYGYVCRHCGAHPLGRRGR